MDAFIKIFGYILSSTTTISLLISIRTLYISKKALKRNTPNYEIEPLDNCYISKYFQKTFVVLQIEIFNTSNINFQVKDFSLQIDDSDSVKIATQSDIEKYRFIVNGSYSIINCDNNFILENNTAVKIFLVFDVSELNVIKSTYVKLSFRAPYEHQTNEFYINYVANSYIKSEQDFNH